MSYFVLHCVRGKIFHPGITASIYPSRPPSWVTPISSQQLERLALRCSPKETTTSCQPKKQPTSCLPGGKHPYLKIWSWAVGLCPTLWTNRTRVSHESGGVRTLFVEDFNVFPKRPCHPLPWNVSRTAYCTAYTMCFDSCCLLFPAQPQTCIVVSIFCFRGEYETSTLWARMSFGRKKLHNRTRE